MNAEPRIDQPAAPVRVLIVEDHNDSLELMTRALRRVGYHVTPVESARAARAIAAREAFDALITDISLPDQDGWSLAREIRAMRPIPVVGVSGHAYPNDISRSKDEGFCAYLVKPITLGALLDAVETCRRHAPK